MEAMISFVDEYRSAYGVEPICRVIKIAPSTYHAHTHRRANPDTAPPRVKRDTVLGCEIQRVFDENFCVYGVRKVWRQLLREGFCVALCTGQGFARSDQRAAHAHDGCRQGGSVSARSCQPPVPA